MRIFLALAFFWACPLVAIAEVSAVLIGVSNYEDGTGIADLKGPANDVALLRDVLARRGVSDITLLADGVEGGEIPTRNAILAALHTKADTISAGDFVYIHYSGHGTQQKDVNGDETDGLDEVLLPADSAPANPGTGLIRNAIVDDEIGTAVDMIRAKGASVWLVLDSCHSGSGLRAAAPNIATRFVDPAVLGVNGAAKIAVEGAQKVTGPEAASDIDLPSGSGGVMAFYAAQSSEVAREIEVTDGKFYGLFTSRLAARLDGGANQSFRQLFQATMRDMNDQSVPGAARMQTPLWSGDLIDAAVFGDASTTSLRRFDVRGDEIRAGMVHGLSDGTLIGLVAEASDPVDAIIGFAQLELTKATNAFLRPVDETCEPSGAVPCPISGSLPPNAKFGQVIAKPVDLVVGFSPPVDLATGQPLAEGHPGLVALQKAIAASPASVALSDTAFDVEVTWDGASLWFGPRTSVRGQLIGRRWQPDAGGLEGVISQIAAAETLDRLLGSLAGTGSILNPSPVKVEGIASPVSVSDLLPADTDVSPVRECTHAIGRKDPAQTGPLQEAAELKQCDGVDFAAKGLVPGAHDVNRIHIDAKYCIHNEYARVEDTAAATRLGSSLILCSNCPDGYNAGDERLFVVVSEAAPNSAPLNLTGLIENCADPGAATRSARAATVDSFLGTLAQGRATRGSLGAIGVSSIWVDRYRWTIIPKEIVPGLSGQSK